MDRLRGVDESQNTLSVPLLCLGQVFKGVRDKIQDVCSMFVPTLAYLIDEF